MVVRLPVKQGISAPAVTSIPEQWDREWFRNFITHFLVGGDVRNAISSGGVVVLTNVSGNQTSTQTATVIGLTPIPTNTVLGNVSNATAEPVSINKVQLTSLINTFTNLLSGSVPASGGGTTNYLRADGTFAAPPGVPGGANTQVQFNNGGAFAGSANLTWNGSTLAVTGTVQGTTLNATSDPKLKKKIRRIENSSEILDGLYGYKFVWKDSDQPSIGVLSRDVKKVAPELVAKDIHESVNYNGLVAVLIEEVKSLKEKIKILESKIG
jgi:hypothetical protein